MEKTNVMRILDAKKIKYTPHSFPCPEAMSADEVARLLGIEEKFVFKTLVTVGKSGKYFVFVVPATAELDLKLAAKAAGEKSIEMIKSKELLPLTGYIHGGCSPIGMKKFFPTFIDASAEELDKFYFSAGKLGYQIETDLSQLRRAIKITAARLC